MARNFDDDPEVARLLGELQQKQTKKDEASASIRDILRELAVLVPEKDQPQ